jgi:Glycosyl hydrolases family 2, TIM barrel domain/Glycosyl hydrolases family 2, sugar binding domain/Glycosyl hydrolases family 2/Beta galactosidase small chain
MRKNPASHIPYVMSPAAHSFALRYGMRGLGCLVFFLILLGASPVVRAQQTEFQYLSGHGKDDAVPWNFLCTSGAHSGDWTNLPVPSNWELHGFGTINYHRDLTNAYQERGLYEHDFSVPANWSGKHVFLVFQGAMTDTSAKLNGQPVGPLHQGGYYQFQYEVTPLVHFGGTNRLEVTVAKHSANTSVNGAERTGDYWMYGGIYRPVYLAAFPAQFIERVAIDAAADGNFSMDVFLNDITNTANADMVEAQIQTLNGKNVGRPFHADISATGPAEVINLKSRILSPQLWTAETPNLYKVQVRLEQRGKVIHRIQQRFGFRTFEVRDGDGLYLNGQRIVLKGCNRHSFWPDSGRCLSDAVQRLDIQTMKDMNMNAVRMSHYPPDADFLDLCDQLGLYVLDELAGWHKAYDTPTGAKLVREMITRDVNHPSILFWDNGNEGGFNTNLDKLFDEYDPQQRRILHPWAPFDGLNTAHYLPYDLVKLAGEGIPISFHKNNYLVNTNSPQKLVFMPTEFLHGLYDGGAGAGLAETWSLMESSRYLGGGFIWAFLDEGVRRADNGQIDVAGNEAPDGIVGPYREREASFYAIKQIWSPMVILETNLPENFDGTLTVENHYNFTDARQCTFTWQLRRMVVSDPSVTPRETVIADGTAKAPAIPPGSSGKLRLNLPENFRHLSGMTAGDFLAVRVNDPDRRELWTYVWPLQQPPVLSGNAQIIARADYSGTNDGITELKGNGMVVRIKDGQLLGVERAGKTFSLSNGPRVAAPGSILKNVSWKLRDDGWLQCDYTYFASGTNDFLGVIFDYPENQVKSKSWFGDGPYRVWKNRRQGVIPGIWQNDYNNTITGWHDWVYPEFKGCFAGVRWLQLQTSEGNLTVVPANVPFVQVLTPEFPPAKLAGHTIPPLPPCGLGFLDAIPPIGSKFQEARIVSPAGDPTVAQGEYSNSVSFYFGERP